MGLWSEPIPSDTVVITPAVKFLILCCGNRFYGEGNWSPESMKPPRDTLLGFRFFGRRRRLWSAVHPSYAEAFLREGVVMDTVLEKELQELERLKKTEIRPWELGEIEPLTGRPVTEMSFKPPMWGTAERHLREYCPLEYARLRKEGRLEEVLDYRVNQYWEEYHAMMDSRCMNGWEIEEVLQPRWIYVTPESDMGAQNECPDFFGVFASYDLFDLLSEEEEEGQSSDDGFSDD